MMPRKLKLTVNRKNEFRKCRDAKKKARECVVSVPVQNVDVMKVAVPIKIYNDSCVIFEPLDNESKTLRCYSTRFESSFSSVNAITMYMNY